MKPTRKVKQRRNQAIGAVVWQGGRLYLKRRYGRRSRAPRVALGLGLAAVAAAVVARRRSGGGDAPAPVA